MSIPENPSLEEFISSFEGSMRILGVTDAPSDMRHAEEGCKMALCKDLVKKVQDLPAGQALLLEFASKRELQVIRGSLYRLRKYLDIPLVVHQAETLMWVSLGVSDGD